MKTIGFATAMVAATLAGWSSVQASKVNVVNGVMKLEESNFNTALEKFPVLMVQFYTPECGQCTSFAPKYEKAARQLRKTDMPAPRLAKVDLNIEKALQKKLDVKVDHEPVIHVYKNGQLYGKYGGWLEKEDIIEYMHTVQSPSVISDIQRSYYRLRTWYRYFVRMTRMPQKLRKIVIMCFPLVWVFALVFLYITVRCCMWCCKDDFDDEKKDAATKGDVATDNKKEQKTKEEPKTEDEKKTD